MPTRWLLLVAALGLLPSPARADETSLRCERGIVAVGDAKIDLLGKCGPPAFQEVREVERAVTYSQPDVHAKLERRSVLTIETWTYDFGPNQFIRLVTLEGGRIVAIERGSYGYTTPEPRAAPAPGPVTRAGCEPEAIRVGMTTYEILARCGEPALRDARVAVHSAWSAGERVSALVTVEIWTYDFGPQTFVRFLEIEDGRLRRIDTGSYGYAR